MAAICYSSAIFLKFGEYEQNRVKTRCAQFSSAIWKINPHIKQTWKIKIIKCTKSEKSVQREYN